MAGLAEQDKWARRGIRPAAFELGGFVSFYAALLRAAVAQAVRAAPVRDPRGPPRVLEAGGDGAAPLSRLSAAGQGVRGSVGLAAFPFYGFPFFGMWRRLVPSGTASACTVVHARGALLPWIHATSSSDDGPSGGRTSSCRPHAVGLAAQWPRQARSAKARDAAHAKGTRVTKWVKISTTCCAHQSPPPRPAAPHAGALRP